MGEDRPCTVDMGTETKPAGTLDSVQTEGSPTIVASPASATEAWARVGESVRRYVVLEEVGRGGMGRVLRAYDPKLQREVALKEVSSRALGGAGSERLAEARAMAKLSHPNVVAVYDVEEIDADRLVIVMEYVTGQTLAGWRRDSPRGWEDILSRFRLAGRGLAAAHAAGVLHRDFKPSNVLVGPDGVVKVTDFGLAKLASARLDDEMQEPGAWTEAAPDDDDSRAPTGDRFVVGTPRYMAPEQHAGLRLTPAVDQYALCIALWEALCERAPFSGPGLEDAKLGGPPPWPGDVVVPRPVVEAIVRGLDPDPDRRWPSVDALLDALADDPTRRRRRGLAAVAATVSLGLATAGGWSWWSARADRCAPADAREHLRGIWDPEARERVQAAVAATGVSFATEAWTRTSAVLDAYASDWVQMHVQTCEATAVRGEQSTEVMDLRMACLHRARMELQAAVGVLADADASTVERAHAVVAQLRPLSQCADVESLRAEVEPPLPAEAEAVDGIRKHLADAAAAKRAGRYDRARAETDAARGEQVGITYAAIETEVAVAHGDLLELEGEYEQADAVLRDALRQASSRGQWNLAREAASTLLFVVGYRQHRFEEGLRYADLALGLADGDARQAAIVSNNIASVLNVEGRYDEAETVLRGALVDGLPDDVTRSYRANLATILHAQGKHADALGEFRRSLELSESMLGPDHPVVALARGNLAAALLTQGRLAEAEVEQRRALEVSEAALGPDSPQVAQSLGNLGVTLRRRGEYDAAEKHLRRALTIHEKALGGEHPLVSQTLINLASVQSAAGKYDEAEATYGRARRVAEATQGDDHPDLAYVHLGLAAMDSKRGRYDDAEAAFRRALEILAAALPPDHPRLAMARADLAGLLLERGRIDEARALVESAWERAIGGQMGALDRGQIAFIRARTLAAGDAPDRSPALEAAQYALEAFEEVSDQENIEQVRAWLADHDG